MTPKLYVMERMTVEHRNMARRGGEQLRFLSLRWVSHVRNFRMEH